MNTGSLLVSRTGWRAIVEVLYIEEHTVNRKRLYMIFHAANMTTSNENDLLTLP